jgi:catechol 2,3-dioxygenase-like lactoylglutathione lyase family enzyme
LKLLGLDHADIRVPSIASVEAFYDAVLPALGLSRKAEAHVGTDGEWYDVDKHRPRNAIEYHTPIVAGSRGWFVGFIEDAAMRPTATRIAFALDAEDQLPAVEKIVRDAGGRVVERSIDEGYPALFFEDPVGTRLEICARRPRL